MGQRQTATSHFDQRQPSHMCKTSIHTRKYQGCLLQNLIMWYGQGLVSGILSISTCITHISLSPRICPSSPGVTPNDFQEAVPGEHTLDTKILSQTPFPPRKNSEPLWVLKSTTDWLAGIIQLFLCKKYPLPQETSLQPSRSSSSEKCTRIPPIMLLYLVLGRTVFPNS